jgi:predicted aminopeptidase
MYLGTKSGPIRFAPQHILLMFIFVLSGCSPRFAFNAIYNESKILLSREPIAEVIADESTPADLRAKLNLVADAREFAISIGLTPGESFTQYSRIDKSPLVWVLAASKPDAFDLHTWWFPFVGSVPYKGFFHRVDADGEARHLAKKDYETFIRGADAFSTLGWFNDPILAATIKRDPTEVANLVIHESVHATVWIPGSVAFNESLANFVGYYATREFFENRKDLVTFEKTKRNLEIEQLLAAIVNALYQDLDAVYKTRLTRAEKLDRRAELYAHHLAPFHKRFPQATILRTPNNAELMQLKLYLSNFSTFENVFHNSGENWAIFFERMKEIAKQTTQDSARDPFTILARISAEPCAFPP